MTLHMAGVCALAVVVGLAACGPSSDVAETRPSTEPTPGVVPTSHTERVGGTPEPTGTARTMSPGGIPASTGPIEPGTFVLGSTSSVEAMDVAPNGSILVGGRKAHDAFMAKLTPAGALDPSFNSTGIVTVDVSAGGTDVLRDLVLTPARKVVATGSSDITDDNDVFVLRLRPNGTPDPAFGYGDPVPAS